MGKKRSGGGKAAVPDTPEPTVTHGPCTWSCVDVTWERRMQTLCLFLAMSLIADYFVVVSAALWFDVLYFRAFLALVLAWQILVDGHAQRRGGRPCAWARRLGCWQHLVNYFPSDLIIEKPLDGSKPHIIAAHPHG